VARWTDTTTYGNLASPDPEDLLPIAHMAFGAGQRQQTITWGQLAALAAAGATVDTIDPTATDDGAAGYAVGSLWYNETSGSLFVCTDETSSGAVWEEISGGGGGGGGGPIEINTQTGTTYTLALADAQKLVTLDNANAITLTVPANEDAAFPVGTVIAIAQLGAGAVTTEGSSGVTINGVTPGEIENTTRYAVWTLTKIGTNEWVLDGTATDPPEGISLLGTASKTSSQAGITTEADVTGLSKEVTVAAGRRIRVAGHVRMSVLQSSGSSTPTRGIIRVYRGTDLVGVIADMSVLSSSALGDGAVFTGAGFTFDAPSAGTHTYKLTAAAIGAGSSVTVAASATGPCHLAIYDDGPT